MISVIPPRPVSSYHRSMTRSPRTIEQNNNLPSELVLDIFELGASIDKNTATSLLRLSTWARKLLLPILYECVALESWSRVDQFKLTLQSKQGAEVHQSVKRLSIAVGEYPMVEILHSCNAITSLVASSVLFRERAHSGSSWFPNHHYQPSLMSPHLTHLTIHGPAYLIHYNQIPDSVTHLVLKDDAPTAGYSLLAVTTLPKLTHLAFNVTQQALPYAPDPSPRMTSLLDALYSRGISQRSPSPPPSAGADMVPSKPKPTSSGACEPMSLIAVVLSPNVDTRIVDTLVNYRSPALRDPFFNLTEEDSDETIPRPTLNVYRDHQCQWWSQEEWATKGGEEVFWKRMEQAPSDTA